MSDEPMCCGEPMVSYMGGWFWECAPALFALQDDGVVVDDGASPPNLIEQSQWGVDLRRLPTTEHREMHAHLIATRLRSDDVTGALSLAGAS